mmetsp:Transcript_97966/g.281835  ORF Transcript_97966/g.281835 Transcript_97966/m.281835 type:complete len:212 (+) Transcript_97966:148-783(+)
MTMSPKHGVARRQRHEDRNAFSSSPRTTPLDLAGLPVGVEVVLATTGRNFHVGPVMRAAHDHRVGDEGGHPSDDLADVCEAIDVVELLLLARPEGRHSDQHRVGSQGGVGDCVVQGTPGVAVVGRAVPRRQRGAQKPIALFHIGLPGMLRADGRSGQGHPGAKQGPGDLVVFRPAKSTGCALRTGLQRRPVGGTREKGLQVDVGRHLVGEL